VRRHFIKALVTKGKKWVLLLLLTRKQMIVAKDQNNRGMPTERKSI
jgi:hypothetical protein